jgi:hypothetical protein|nr:MAG TPA: hypothetical protein [Caudoviricetes sp.]
MFIKQEKAKEGYEEVVALFDKIIGGIDDAKAKEIAAIEQKYADRREKYVSDRKLYVEETEIEVPDITTDNGITPVETGDDTEALINELTGGTTNA